VERTPGDWPSSQGAGTPFSGSYGPGYGPRAPFAGPEGFGGPPRGFPGRGYGYGYGYGGDRPGIQVSRRTSEDAYVLDIQLRGMRPDEVQVRTQGRWITIDRVGSAQEVRQEQFDDGRGYAHSYSYSSGTATRRMTLPPDADASAMQREDGESSIRIRFPRTDRGFGYGAPLQR
jgi:HSP20 family molecular chaperone IbpA